MTASLYTEAIMAVHELLLENLVNHEVFSFGIIVYMDNQSGWYITQEDELLRVSPIEKLRIARNVAKIDAPPQYEWRMVKPPSPWRNSICLTVHGSGARATFEMVDRMRTLDLNDPESLDDLLELVR